VSTLARPANRDLYGGPGGQASLVPLRATGTEIILVSGILRVLRVRVHVAVTSPTPPTRVPRVPCFVRKYESTFVLSYFRTKVRKYNIPSYLNLFALSSYFRKYFRTTYSTSVPLVFLCARTVLYVYFSRTTKCEGMSYV
jgi:hypothetical protein